MTNEFWWQKALSGKGRKIDIYIDHETELCMWANWFEHMLNDRNDRNYSGTRNSLSVKMRARTLDFVFSQVYHGSSCHSVGLFWLSIDRDMWGERDDSICGQKIHILPTGLKSKRWRQLRRNERPGNSEFVSSYVWGENTSNVPLMTVGVQLVLDFILFI